QTIIRQSAEQYDLLAERRHLLAELQARNEELEKANALKEAFIRVASHELRTPLTILLGLTELALLTPATPAETNEYLSLIHQAGLRLARLADQLIKMLQAGRFERPLERSPVDLAALAREAAEDVRPFVEKRRQKLALELAPDLGVIHVDAGKLRDSLDNLLLN